MQLDTNTISEHEMAGIVTAIAATCHETNRAIQTANGEEVAPPWNELSPEAKNGSVEGVLFVMSNPDVTPEKIHKNWMKYKLKTGWQYGEKKDTALKFHPNLVPFAKLDTVEKMKDHVFISVVQSMRRVLGV